MPYSSLSTTAADRRDALDSGKLPGQIFLMRAFGMALAMVPMAAVFFEHKTSVGSWIFLFFAGFVWPHLALQLAVRSKRPNKSEIRNLMLDPFLIGICVGLMQFNLLPSVLMIVTVIADRLNTGIRDLWLKSLPVILIGILIGSAATGFGFATPTSMTVIIACLPMVIFYVLSVGSNARRLVSIIQDQNKKLLQLSNLDSLTELSNRGHWQYEAEKILRHQQKTDSPATLMLMDVDDFKTINDRHGHVVGDDVLNAIAALIKKNIRDNDIAGRYGGDEFAIITRNTAEAAKTIAERIMQQVDSINQLFDDDVQCTISIGIAEASGKDLSLREWLESADQALYQAKSNKQPRAGKLFSNPANDAMDNFSSPESA